MIAKAKINADDLALLTTGKTITINLPRNCDTLLLVSEENEEKPLDALFGTAMEGFDKVMDELDKSFDRVFGGFKPRGK
jgi:hypothetical protein